MKKICNFLHKQVLVAARLGTGFFAVNDMRHSFLDIGVKSHVEHDERIAKQCSYKIFYKEVEHQDLQDDECRQSDKKAALNGGVHLVMGSSYLSALFPRYTRFLLRMVFL